MAPIKNTNKGFIGSFISRVGISTQIFNRPSLVAVAATSTTPNIFTPGNGYRYHIFTQPGRFYVFNSGYIDFCVVAGGGAGGAGSAAGLHGGGGGAGGFVEKYNILCPTGFYDVCTGIGGAANATPPTAAVARRNGTPSFVSGPVGFTSITSTGGGHGGCAPAGAGQPGGSGGGGSSPAGAAGNGTGSGLTREGYPGGGGGPAISGPGGSAGGAGRIGNVDAGVAAVPGLAAFGGDTGVPPAYGETNPTPLPGRWFAGGGGGVPLASGGIGGGGSGGPTTGNGVDATIYTGGGGGGSGGPGNQSGAGGPGIVLIRYRNTTLTF
jgi:hypothetical protein